MTMDFSLVTKSVLASGPEIIVIIGACIALMLSLIHHPQKESMIAGLSVAMIALAAAMSYFLADYPQVAYAGMFIIDDFSTYFKMILYLGTTLTIFMSGKYLVKEGIVHDGGISGEYYVLIMFALVGSMIMVSGTDLLIIYIGLELQAFSIYVLTGYLKKDVRSNEAALKYVILGAFSSGLILYGMSLIYGLTGTTQLDGVATAISAIDLADPLLIMATLFMVAGLLFKVGAVPFHMWVPDIYEGAPSPITGYMSVAAKAAAFAVIIRIFMSSLSELQPMWMLSVSYIAVLTMAIGSFVALVQDNIKRMLAYSSISHAGFLLLGLIAGGSDGVASIMLYMLVYTFMNLGIFAIIILLNKGAASGEPIDSFAGLAKNHAGLAFLALIFLFSLAGIPPTGGFFAKFYVLMALIDTGHVLLAVIAVLMSAVAAWFYIRIIMLMYVKEPTGAAEIQITLSMKVVLLVTLIGTLMIGILPAWFLGIAGTSVPVSLG